MKYGIDAVLDKVDIVDLVSRYVKLKKSGRNFVGLCPFHKEKTPSFTVSPEKQLFYCFGCHTGGNAINFVMKYENLDFQDALESIAKEYGIPLKEWQKKTTSIYDALGELADFYHSNLKINEAALKYLKERGIGWDIIEEFKLGFSGKDLSELFATSKIPKDIFFSTGIFRISGREVHDIFWGRIVIPIFDVNGRVIGFGGRTIDKDRMPKYINSPDSQVFQKRSILFGIEKTKRQIVEKNFAIVVEGYFDMITLYKFGVKNVVASLGTAITEEQIKKLKNYTENITLMLDSDDAGIRSALRAIETFSNMNINGEIVLLPENEDPDSFARKNGHEGLSFLISKRKPVIDYYFDYYKQKYGIETVNKKLAFIRTLLPYVEKMRDNVHKMLYVKRISELTGVGEHLFWDEIKNRPLEIPSEEEGNEKKILPPVTRVVLGCMLNDPELAVNSGLREVLKDLKERPTKDLFNKFFEMDLREDQFDVNKYLAEFDDQDIKNLIISVVFETQSLEREAKRKIIDDYVKYIKESLVREKLKGLTERLVSAEKQRDERKILEILTEKKEILRAFRSN
jgi:DNA primase